MTLLQELSAETAESASPQEIVTEYKYEFGSQEEMINEFKRRMGMVVEDYEESERVPQPEGGTSSFIFGDNE